MLAIFVCFAIGYDLGKRLKQEGDRQRLAGHAGVSDDSARLEDHTLVMDGLGSKGLFTAIVVALVTVRVQQFFTDVNWSSGCPTTCRRWSMSRFCRSARWCFWWRCSGWSGLSSALTSTSGCRMTLQPLVFALNTLPGILVYAFLVTLLWSVGINGDNTMDAIVAPVLPAIPGRERHRDLAGPAAALHHGVRLLHGVVNVGGTGATIALALLMLNSRDPAFRKVSRLSLPTQVFPINEPIFFGFPIVLNPVFVVPYVINALILTPARILLMGGPDHHRALCERSMDDAAHHRAITSSRR